MILVDTGPLIAIFDPSDKRHRDSMRTVATFELPLATTLCVLTETFYMLSPESVGARNLMNFVDDGGLEILEVDGGDLKRMFELMVQYADAPMDLADASLVAMAERLHIRRIFTIDRNDFAFYRIRLGHRHTGFEVIGAP